MRVGRLITVTSLVVLLLAGSFPGPTSSAAPVEERMLVGFDAVPRDLEPGDAYRGGRVVEVNDALRFAVVVTKDRGSFEGAATSDANVRYVDVDEVVDWLQFVPSDPLWPQQYGPQHVLAPEAWDLTTGTTARNVCIVDTGVRYTHEDLAGARWLGGYDFINNDADPWDDHGHGTHVAGTAAGGLDNGKGIAGLGNVGVNAAKVLGASGSGSFSAVASGIQWCADHQGHVISMSLGASSTSPVLTDAVNYAWGKGSLLVAAAGNSGPCSNCIGYPANYENVMAITCTDSADTPCWFTSTGPEADLAAPGFAVLSSWNAGDDSYKSLSGTSMSTPHVSGVAALVWSTFPAMTNGELRDLLRVSAHDLGNPGWDATYGYGLVDAANLLRNVVVPAPEHPLFEEPFDDGAADGWTLSGLWRVDDQCVPAAPTPAHYLGYHRADACTYDTTTATSGNAAFTVDLSDALTAQLTLAHRFQLESSGRDAESIAVQASANGGASWSDLWRRDSADAAQPLWGPLAFDLDAYRGAPLSVRFAFASGDAVANANPGWYLDDVRVLASTNFLPVAVAGPDASLTDGDGDGNVTFLVDGSRSFDADGTLASFEWFENGLQLATGPTASLTFGLGAHAVTLRVTDDDGDADEDAVLLGVGPNLPPLAAFGVLCPTLHCVLDAGSSEDADGAIVAYAWDFGDGSPPATGQRVEHDYATQGVYTVGLTVTDDGGAEGATGRAITVPLALMLDEDFDDGAADGWTLTGLWNVDDICLTAPSLPNHLGYHRTGACDYDVGTTAGAATVTVDLASAAFADLTFLHLFETEYNLDPSPYDVRRVQLSRDGGGTWTTVAEWDSLDPNLLSWTPMTIGLDAYTGERIQLRFVFDSLDPAYNHYRGWYLDDVRIEAWLNRPPVADAGLNQVLGDDDNDGSEVVALDGSASRDPGGAIVAWNWTEGGVPLATTPSFSHAFPVGLHNVRLTVTDNGGATAFDEVLVTVTPNQPPLAVAGPDVTRYDSDGTGAETVRLDGSASRDLDGSLVATVWTEGAVTLGTTPVLDVPFALGEHAVRLTVTDNGGVSVHDDVLVRVFANTPPTAAFAATCLTSTCAFDASASTDPNGAIVAYRWTFGDSKSFASASPFASHLYKRVADYEVCLTVDDGVVTDTTCQTVRPFRLMFEETFDDGVATGWTYDDYWEIRTAGLCSSAATAPRYLANHHPGACHWAHGFALGANAKFAYDLADTPHARLDFAMHGDIEPYDGTRDDRLQVQQSYTGTLAGPWTTLRAWDTADRPPAAWTTFSVDLSPFSDEAVFLRFRAETNDGIAKDQHAGYYVDSVRIWADTPSPLNLVPNVAAGADRVLSDGDSDGLVTLGLAGSATDSDGTVDAYEWLVDGVPVATTPSTTVTLPLGAHVLTLRATDDEGGVGEDSLSVSVGPDLAPPATFAVCGVGHHWSFDARDLVDPDGTIVSYDWDLGDGARASTPFVGRAYESGDYDVTLTVVDDGGASSTRTVSFRAQDLPARPAPLLPSPFPQAPDARTTDLADRGLPTADIQSAWLDADDARVYVGLKVRDLSFRRETASDVAYVASFLPSYALEDPTWGGRIPAGYQLMALRVQALLSPVSLTPEADPEVDAAPRFEFQAQVRAPGGPVQVVTLGALTGSIDAASDIFWWTIPRDALQNPAPGDALAGLTATSQVAVRGVLPPGATLDSTGNPGAEFRMPCGP